MSGGPARQGRENRLPMLGEFVSLISRSGLPYRLYRLFLCLFSRSFCSNCSYDQAHPVKETWPPGRVARRIRDPLSGPDGSNGSGLPSPPSPPSLSSVIVIGESARSVGIALSIYRGMATMKQEIMKPVSILRRFVPTPVIHDTAQLQVYRKGQWVQFAWCDRPSRFISWSPHYVCAFHYPGSVRKFNSYCEASRH